mmetsp:Transcript_9884/g.32055  ORF Transcript_9884/g.32055 Transcript_9884/m.32055 type:complete len:203 (-) Transcript_9884:46-654(-)
MSPSYFSSTTLLVDCSTSSPNSHLPRSQVSSTTLLLVLATSAKSKSVMHSSESMQSENSSLSFLLYRLALAAISSRRATRTSSSETNSASMNSSNPMACALGGSMRSRSAPFPLRLSGLPLRAGLLARQTCMLRPSRPREGLQGASLGATGPDTRPDPRMVRTAPFLADSLAGAPRVAPAASAMVEVPAVSHHQAPTPARGR